MDRILLPVLYGLRRLVSGSDRLRCPLRLLITRRSQVQILPPQPRQRPGSVGEFSRSRAFSFWGGQLAADHRLTKTLHRDCFVRGFLAGDVGGSKRKPARFSFVARVKRAGDSPLE